MIMNVTIDIDLSTKYKQDIRLQRETWPPWPLLSESVVHFFAHLFQFLRSDSKEFTLTKSE